MLQGLGPCSLSPGLPPHDRDHDRDRQASPDFRIRSQTLRLTGNHHLELAAQTLPEKRDPCSFQSILRAKMPSWEVAYSIPRGCSLYEGIQLAKLWRRALAPASHSHLGCRLPAEGTDLRCAQPPQASGWPYRPVPKDLRPPSL